MTRLKTICFLFLFCNMFVALQAQKDSLKYRLGLSTAHGKKNYIPHWLVSNQNGLYRNDAGNSNFLGAVEYKSRELGKFVLSSKLSWRANTNYKSILGNLQEAYVQFNLKKLSLRMGAKEEYVGSPMHELSSGSLAMSNNARPIPKIGIGFFEYTKVPYTKDFVEFKGYYDHGWLEKNRFVEQSLLHQKQLYLRFGGDFPVNISGGYVHEVLWAGKHPVFGELTSDLNAYYDAITASKGENKSGPRSDSTNALGNHIGMYDFNVSIQFKKFKVQLYHQTLFEDGSGSKLFKNRDGLLGIQINLENRKGKLSDFTYEYLHSTYQSGPGLADKVEGQSNYGHSYGGRDDYYNNGVYRSGWTYHGRTIGNSLFTTSQRASLLLNDLKDYGFFIANNRIKAHHIGLQGWLADRVHYKILANYSLNYGTYTGLNNGKAKWESIENPEFSYAFDPALEQFYLMFELEKEEFIHPQLKTSISLGADFGDMTNNLGVLIGLKWTGLILPNTPD